MRKKWWNNLIRCNEVRVISYEGKRFSGHSYSFWSHSTLVTVKAHNYKNEKLINDDAELILACSTCSPQNSSYFGFLVNLQDKVRTPMATEWLFRFSIVLLFIIALLIYIASSHWCWSHIRCFYSFVSSLIVSMKLAICLSQPLPC